MGTIFDEVLYADDTIIHSPTPENVTKLLHKIETEGAKYGLKLNEGKCEALTIREEFRETTDVFFKNGKQVKQLSEGK